jgi:glutamine synthetase
VRVVKAESNISLDLRARVAGGSYEVDPHAVAEAMMRRMGASSRSAVLVPRELLDEVAPGAHELQPRPARDVA